MQQSFFRKRAGIAPLIILLILAALAAAGGGTYVVIKKQQEKQAQAKEKMVTEQVDKIRKEGLVITLSMENDSGESGTATLINQNNNKTKVVIQTTGWKPGVIEPAHIHSGACPTPGEVKYPLNNVVNGRSESMIDKSLADLLKELPLAINVHKSLTEAKIYVACGDISGNPDVLEKLKEKSSAAGENEGMGKDGTGSVTGTTESEQKGTERSGGQDGAVSSGPNVKGIAAVKVFTVTASNYLFDVKNITVKQGDRVRIVFKNEQGFHDFKLDEFNVATGRLQAGGEETVEFTADRTGTFEYYCSVGSHRAMGMKGELTVE